mmetsp:Transcript_59784/g.164582  ORF Transcript_59784/g.164582 Transcript_59784/m.164582 type:complete len:496 (-) Transcript_59784:280-1767(-)
MRVADAAHELQALVVVREREPRVGLHVLERVLVNVNNDKFRRVKKDLCAHEEVGGGEVDARMPHRRRLLLRPRLFVLRDPSLREPHAAHHARVPQGRLAHLHRAVLQEDREHEAPLLGVAPGGVQPRRESQRHGRLVRARLRRLGAGGRDARNLEPLGGRHLRHVDLRRGRVVEVGRQLLTLLGVVLPRPVVRTGELDHPPPDVEVHPDREVAPAVEQRLVDLVVAAGHPQGEGLGRLRHHAALEQARRDRLTVVRRLLLEHLDGVVGHVVVDCVDLPVAAEGFGVVPHSAEAQHVAIVLQEGAEALVVHRVAQRRLKELGHVALLLAMAIARHHRDIRQARGGRRQATVVHVRRQRHGVRHHDTQRLLDVRARARRRVDDMELAAVDGHARVNGEVRDFEERALALGKAVALHEFGGLAPLPLRDFHSVVAQMVVDHHLVHERVLDEVGMELQRHGRRVLLRRRALLGLRTEGREALTEGAGRLVHDHTLQVWH